MFSDTVNVTLWSASHCEAETKIELDGSPIHDINVAIDNFINSAVASIVFLYYWLQKEIQSV